LIAVEPRAVIVTDAEGRPTAEETASQELPIPSLGGSGKGDMHLIKTRLLPLHTRVEPAALICTPTRNAPFSYDFQEPCGRGRRSPCPNSKSPSLQLHSPLLAPRQPLVTATVKSGRSIAMLPSRRSSRHLITVKLFTPIRR